MRNAEGGRDIVAVVRDTMIGDGGTTFIGDGGSAFIGSAPDMQTHEEDIPGG